MDYIETPIKPERVGKGQKMPNKSTNTAEPKAAKKYAKTRGEHVKDILIAMLVTGIIAFVGGMHFSNQQHSQTAQAVKNAIAPSASAQAATSK